MSKTSNPFLMGDNVYAIIKRFVQVILPAISALYFALAEIWGLPHAMKVMGTISAITVFLSISMGISSAQYEATGARFDGDLIVTKQVDGPKVLSLELTKDPDAIEKKDSISFKVKNQIPDL